MIAYAGAWLVFGLVHSLSSREPAKAVLRRMVGRGMRLCWNGLAVVELAVVLWVGKIAMVAVPLDRPGWVMVAQGGIGIGGLVVLGWAVRGYDMRRFVGVAQIGGDVEDEEPFRVDGMLGFVRHPLYLGALMVLAGVVRDTTSLATAVFATGYILVGLRFEERALIRRFGPAYEAYRARVPALVPWRGRAWPGRG